MTLITELRQVIAELELISEVRAAKIGRTTPNTTDEGLGGRCPGAPTTMTHADGPDDFRERMARASSGRQLRSVLEDARKALEHWKRSAKPSEPVRGDPQFKRWLAESPDSVETLVHRFGITRQYVYRVRKQYRDAA